MPGKKDDSADVEASEIRASLSICALRDEKVQHNETGCTPGSSERILNVAMKKENIGLFLKAVGEAKIYGHISIK